MTYFQMLPHGVRYNCTGKKLFSQKTYFSLVGFLSTMRASVELQTDLDSYVFNCPNDKTSTAAEFANSLRTARIRKTTSACSQRKRGDALLYCSKSLASSMQPQTGDRNSRELVTLTSGRMRDDDKQLPAAAWKMATNKR